MLEIRIRLRALLLKYFAVFLDKLVFVLIIFPYSLAYAAYKALKKKRKKKS